MLDLAILTPLDEEFVEMRSCINVDPPLARKDMGPVVYWLGTLRGGVQRYTIALASLGSMGTDETAAFVMQLLSVWKPASIALLGIAGSFRRGDHQLGDVIVSHEIVGYTVAAQEADGAVYRPSGHHPSRTMTTRARAVLQDPGSLAAFKAECLARAADLGVGEDVRLGGPDIHVGVTASGNNVVKSEAFRDSLKKLHPKLIGVEMEARGLFTALIHSDEHVRPFMVRGVSDFADESKATLDASTKGAIRKYAARNAAVLLDRVIRSDLGRPATDPIAVSANIDEDPRLAIELGNFREYDGAQHLGIRSVFGSDRPVPEVTLELAALGPKGEPASLTGHVRYRRRDKSTRDVLLGRVDLTGSGVAVLKLKRSHEPYFVDVSVAPDQRVDGIVVTATDEFGRRASAAWRASGV